MREKPTAVEQAEVKIGLIARCEYARGIAIQSLNFYQNMPVDKVLLVRKQAVDLDCDERPEWYPGATEVVYDHVHHTLDQAVCMSWLEGLDVVFTVETPYDWRFPDWARNMHVKTVIQANPEFYRHDQSEQMIQAQDYRAHPDAWWYPTSWRTDRLPPGRLMPVPMPDTGVTARQRGVPRFLHVVGKRAYEDRNGTDIVINALRSIEEPCDFTINGFGWELPPIDLPFNCPVRLSVERAGVSDRWSMYAGQSLLVLPRRYGGLCLPALEAAACGLAVLMPNCSPNNELATLFINGRDERQIRLACGHIHPTDVDFRDLGAMLTDLIRHPEQVWEAQQRSLRNVPRWSEYRQSYVDELEYVCNQR